MTEQQSNLEQQSTEYFQKKIKCIARSARRVEIEKISSIRNKLWKAGKQVNNEQVANMVFSMQRNLLNALMANRCEAVERFTDKAREFIRGKRDVVSAGGRINGVILTLLDSSGSDKDFTRVDSNIFKHELYMDDKWETAKINLHRYGLNDDLINWILNCIVRRLGKFEDELLVYNIMGQKKLIKDPRGLARPAYVQRMPQAASILPPANLSYITHTSNDKGYEMDRPALERLQELRANPGEFATGNNIFTAIDKALKYSRIEPIYINAHRQWKRRKWRAICLFPWCLYLKLQEEGRKPTATLPKDINPPGPGALSPFGHFDSDGFTYNDILFVRTNQYVFWDNEDPVTLCEKDGITTKWYKKGASGEGFSEDDPAELTGEIPKGKSMYRLALIGADAIRCTYEHLNEDILGTDFTFIKIPGHPFNKIPSANPYQHIGMQRRRKETDNGLEEPHEDAGIFTIDLIADSCKARK